MEYEACMKTLKNLGNPSMRKTYLNAGAQEPLFGVKMGDLHKFAEDIGIDHALALSLYVSGNHDAMMLGGMICDPNNYRGNSESVRGYIAMRDGCTA